MSFIKVIPTTFDYPNDKIRQLKSKQTLTQDILVHSGFIYDYSQSIE